MLERLYSRVIMFVKRPSAVILYISSRGISIQLLNCEIGWIQVHNFVEHMMKVKKKSLRVIKLDSVLLNDTQPTSLPAVFCNQGASHVYLSCQSVVLSMMPKHQLNSENGSVSFPP